MYFGKLVIQAVELTFVIFFLSSWKKTNKETMNFYYLLANTLTFYWHVSIDKSVAISTGMSISLHPKLNL